MTSSCHRCLGLPTGLVPIGFQSNSFLVGLAWSVFWICPSHLILCASATIFNLILDSVIKNLSLRGDVSLKLKKIVAYADDVALLVRSPLY